MKNSGLTKEQKVLLKLTARSINSDSSILALTKEELSQVDWKQIKEQSMAQAVALVVYDVAVQYQEFIPEKVMDEWKDYAMAVYVNNFRIMQAQNDMVNLIKSDYKYLILKGLSAGRYYSHPELRALGDVDFLIEDDKKERLEKVFLDAGYAKYPGDHPSHVLFKKGFAQLEMHFEVAGIPYGDCGEKIREFLKGAFDGVEAVQQDICEFYAPDHIYHALILLLHMQHHLIVEGFGVRHLHDWAVFIKETENEPFWKEKFLSFLEEIGLLKFTKVMTKTCAKYLGSSLPEWASDADDKLCDDVIEDVMEGGNFGRNDKNRDNSEFFVYERGKTGKKRSRIKSLLLVTHKEVMRRYPLIRKLPIIYPFLYAYRGCRYIFLSAIGKRSSLFKTGKVVKERQELYDKLRVFKK